jgi:hypothetical protein
LPITFVTARGIVLQIDMPALRVGLVRAPKIGNLILKLET